MNDKAALLILEMQLGFFENIPAVYDADGVLHNARVLMNKARYGGVPVIFVQDIANLAFTGPLHPLIAPSEQDHLILKQHADSFEGTDLHRTLAWLAVRHLLIMGFRSEISIAATCCTAASHGLRASLIADAHSTYHAPPLTAQEVIQMQNDHLRSFVEITQSSQVKFTRAGCLG